MRGLLPTRIAPFCVQLLILHNATKLFDFEKLPGQLEEDLFKCGPYMVRRWKDSKEENIEDEKRGGEIKVSAPPTTIKESTALYPNLIEDGESLRPGRRQGTRFQYGWPCNVGRCLSLSSFISSPINCLLVVQQCQNMEWFMHWLIHLPLLSRSIGRSGRYLSWR